MSILLFCAHCGRPEKLTALLVNNIVKIDSTLSCKTCKHENPIPLDLRVEALLIAHKSRGFKDYEKK